MRHTLLSSKRALLCAGVALAVLACAALYAVPGQPPAAQTVATTQDQPAVPNVNGRMIFPNVRVENAPAPVEQAAPALGQRAFIDPATRRLREATPEEHLDLERAVAARKRTLKAAGPATSVQGPEGSDMVILGEDQMVYTVATVDAAKKVSVEHATGPTEAAAKMTTKAAAKKGKGAGHDR